MAAYIESLEREVNFQDEEVDLISRSLPRTILCLEIVKFAFLGQDFWLG